MTLPLPGVSNKLKSEFYTWILEQFMQFKPTPFTAYFNILNFSNFEVNIKTEHLTKFIN